MTYSDEVLADAPWGYYRLAEGAGDYADASPNGRTMTPHGSGVVPTWAPGPVPDGTSVFFDWTELSYCRSEGYGFVADEFTLETWVLIDRLPDSPMGLIGNGAIPGNASGATEVGMHLLGGGALGAYLYGGAGPSGMFLNTGYVPPLMTWVLVAMRCTHAEGTVLYANGVEVGSDSTMTPVGYSREVFLHAGGWQSTNQKGALSEPALYDHDVTPERLAVHYAASGQTGGGDGGDGGGGTNVPPVADWRTVDYTDGLSVTFEDSSSDPDGSIASWLWEFGDGATSSDQNPTHVYAEFGSYSVSLTVTDDGGATATLAGDLMLMVPGGGGGDGGGGQTGDDPDDSDPEPEPDEPASTDTADLAGGRSRTGAATDYTLHPVPPVPNHLRVEPMRVVAMQLPTPTLKNGRPS